MDEQLKLAFASATETVKNTLTLSSAILTVSITFIKDINKHPHALEVWIIEASWVALLVSVIACIATLAAITGTLAKINPLNVDTLYKPNIQRPMITAFCAFLVGMNRPGF